MTKLAVSTDYLESLARLPNNVQKKANLMIKKYRANPQSQGLNLEKIVTPHKASMWSLRLDKAYRAIAVRQSYSGTLLLLWIDHHDQAYKWAKKHHCEVHPDTGTLQIFEPIHSSAESLDPKPTEQTYSPFSKLTDQQLRKFGIPQPMISEARRIGNDAELETIKSRLPTEAYESLFYYLAGDSYKTIVRNLASQKERVNTDNIDDALKHPASQSKFRLIEDDLELEKILNQPLELWRVFLHPVQRSLVERDWNGPVRVLGAAGTGKSVVAIHRVKWLAQKLLDTPSDHRKVLLVTFNKNLAADLESKLSTICDPQLMKKIEVTNIDAWVFNFLIKRQNMGYTLRYSSKRKESSEWNQALKQKPTELNLPDTFYEQEWEDLIQLNNIQTRKQYVRASRIGRRSPLKINARLKIWKVFEEYYVRLAESGKKEFASAYSDAIDILESSSYPSNYSSVVVDEAQDIGFLGFKLLRNLVAEAPNDMFIVGDSHQRIYKKGNVVLGHCGIRIIGRSRKLRLNYRTTKETHRWAEKLLIGKEYDDLDGGIDNISDVQFRTSGASPKVKIYSSFLDQCNAIGQFLKQLSSNNTDLSRVCIVCRTKSDRDHVQELLISQGFDSRTYVLQQELHDTKDDKVRLATAHRIKGLEFDYIIIANCNQETYPLQSILNQFEGDIYAKEDLEKMERSLLYVASTRAKKRVLVFCHSKPSDLIPPT